MSRKSPNKTAGHILGPRFSDPDLVDRLFDYVVALIPEIAERHVEIKSAIRDEFACERVYIRRHCQSSLTAQKVLGLFDGRNASEVARKLGISRATVYRMLKQPGRTVES